MTNWERQETSLPPPEEGRQSCSKRCRSKRFLVCNLIGIFGVAVGILLLTIAIIVRTSASSGSPTQVDEFNRACRGNRCQGEEDDEISRSPVVPPTGGRGRPPVRSSASPTSTPTTAPTSPPSVSALPSGSVLPTSIPSAEPTLAPSANPSDWPSWMPSLGPSLSPTGYPSLGPTVSRKPSPSPTSTPTSSPTASPTEPPTAGPTPSPTVGSTQAPTVAPSVDPTEGPTDGPTRIAFDPGKLTVRENGLLLSTGLTSRLLARAGQPVVYDTAYGGSSTEIFHDLPDFGATFVDPRNEEPGGYIYVSNSEVRPQPFNRGGVGALTFDRQGRLVNYQRVLTGTTSNCGGGKTPWGAWISCEEYGRGLNWQVDPTGRRSPQVITLGNDGGVFESFSYDIRNRNEPYFFVTEDNLEGALQRWRPDNPDWERPWSILLGSGTTDFLVLDPNTGTFAWTSNRARAKENASLYYPNSEGIDVYEGRLFFISKRRKAMITLDLDTETYSVESTSSGLFNGGPDQIKRILNDDSELLFFTEDGSGRAGIHARNQNGEYTTILESPDYAAETTGLAFSPDGMAMYVAYQVEGLLFEIRREDGLPFHARTLNVRFHAGSTVLR